MRPLPAAELLAGCRGALRKLAQTARLAVGIPDYQGYVSHRRLRHPGEPVMSYEEFFRERLAARYRRGTSRCC
ncbi:MAG: YbdD/YjiX family protein [Nevskia sp.]|nr:YbdD/YjiX family protein [Nevskia sp.]